MEKKLGKLENVRFGIGGYNDACIGLLVTISGDGWGVCSDRTTWDAKRIKHTERCKWTEEERNASYSDIVHYISGLLAGAKVKSVDKLNGIPVEATFEKMELKSWRILTEVL